MKKRNNLHSFTLWPKASDIVSKIKRGRKSQFVSKAIIWYDAPSGQQARSHQELMERYRAAQYTINELMIEIEILDTKVTELKKSQSFISKMRNKWSK
jgi:hypothetical protein